jgi:hypothetical protein
VHLVGFMIRKMLWVCSSGMWDNQHRTSAESRSENLAHCTAVRKVCTAAHTFSLVGGDGWVFHTGSKITHTTVGASAHVLLPSDEDRCMNVLHLTTHLPTYSSHPPNHPSIHTPAYLPTTYLLASLSVSLSTELAINPRPPPPPIGPNTPSSVYVAFYLPPNQFTSLIRPSLYELVHKWSQGLTLPPHSMSMQKVVMTVSRYAK